ncbi:hypothetical protein T261_03845 [Streptomyces lydicus]|nr:hypothetical protein T261_03845 [Streptomyces lydicus]
MRGGRWSAEWWRRRAQLARTAQASSRQRRELEWELHALSADPAFAAEFVERLRQCIARQR